MRIKLPYLSEEFLLGKSLEVKELLFSLRKTDGLVAVSGKGARSKKVWSHCSKLLEF